jgi:hypothetical protein
VKQELVVTALAGAVGGSGHLILAISSKAASVLVESTDPTGFMLQ